MNFYDVMINLSIYIFLQAILLINPVAAATFPIILLRMIIRMITTLNFKFKNSYMTYNETKNNVYWHEFVTPRTADKLDGQLYKWRCIGSHPDRILMYISQEFKELASIVNNELKAICTGEDNMDADSLKYARDIQRNFKNTVKSIFNNGFKKSVVDEASSVKWTRLLTSLELAMESLSLMDLPLIWLITSTRIQFRYTQLLNTFRMTRIASL